MCCTTSAQNEIMPISRQKQGIGGSSSIAYTRWEPLNENDIDGQDDNLEKGTKETSQASIAYREILGEVAWVDIRMYN